MAGAPVKLMLDRKEEHLAGGNRPSSSSKIKAGVAADGTLVAFDAESHGTGGAGVGAGFPLPYIYTFPNRRRRHKDVYTNAGPARAMRAPGHPQGCFVTELLMDELADKVRMDPVAFRMKNLPAEAPNAMWRQYFPKAAEQFGWNKRHPDRRSDAGPDQARHGLRRQPVGRRRARHARRTSRSCRTAASSCAAARRTSAPARARSWRWWRPKRSACPIRPIKAEIGDSALSRSAAAAAAARRARR